MIECDIEVVTFVATDGAYYFIMGDRRRGDIIKVRTLQPTIYDHADYSSYLWIKSVQGYFVLRQQFLDNRATEWRVIREVEVEEPEPHFFDEAADRFLAEFEAAAKPGQG